MSHQSFVRCYDLLGNCSCYDALWRKGVWDRGLCLWRALAIEWASICWLCQTLTFFLTYAFTCLSRMLGLEPLLRGVTSTIPNLKLTLGKIKYKEQEENFPGRCSRLSHESIYRRCSYGNNYPKRVCSLIMWHSYLNEDHSWICS